MKKIFLLAILLATLTNAVAQAQNKSETKSTRIGIRVGANFNSLPMKYENNKGLSGIGTTAMHAGLTADFRLAGNLYLSTGAWYIPKGDAEEIFVSNVDAEDADAGNGKKYRMKTSMSYIEVPLLASYIYPVTPKFRVRADVGPYAAYGLSGKRIFEEASSKGLLGGLFADDPVEVDGPFKKDDDGYADYKRLDYGLRFGAAIEFRALTLGVAYDFGLANLIDGAPDDFLVQHCKTNTRSLLVSLGLNF